MYTVWNFVFNEIVVIQHTVANPKNVTYLKNKWYFTLTTRKNPNEWVIC